MWAKIVRGGLSVTFATMKNATNVNICFPPQTRHCGRGVSDPIADIRADDSCEGWEGLRFKRRPASFRVGRNMATSTKVFGVNDKRLSLKPERFDGFLSVAAMVLLAFVFAALFRGRAQWSHVPLIVWAHLVTIVVATALTPIMLLRRRGDWVHRCLGWLWASAMALTALLTFGIRGLNGGGLSFIHILSAWTLVQVPVIIWTTRSHQVARHRSAVRGMVTGALIIAGVFTFPFGRLLGRWLFG